MTPEEKYGPLGPGRDDRFELDQNVRELGGYQVSDGRHVKRGLIWRTGALSWLSEEELGVLASFGPRTNLDLRSVGEATEMPDPAIEGMEYQRFCAMRTPDGEDVDFSPSGLGKLFEEMLSGRGGVEGLGIKDMITELYVGMPYGNPAYHYLFERLEAGEAPIVFHCTAGKDRTGVAAMLILLALGASEEDVLFDYELTNTYKAKTIEREVARVRALGKPGMVDDEAVREMVGVNVAMARTVLTGILDRFGSYEAYFQEEYGLDAARLSALQDRYCE